MTLETVSEAKSFGGTQGVYRHALGRPAPTMTFAVFVPEHAPGAKLPVLWYLSGLTCTHANVMDKGEYRARLRRARDHLRRARHQPARRRRARRRGLRLRPGRGVLRRCDAGAVGGALPHAQLHRAASCPRWSPANFPVDMDRQGITGHSMGGHGALTISLRNPGRFRSTSAFAPIVSPLNCPWGEKALGGYLGDDRAAWRALRRLRADRGRRAPARPAGRPGHRGQFPRSQLKTHLLDEACRKADMPATIRMQEGYDHSYFFISTFMAEHVAWHAERLKT